MLPATNILYELVGIRTWLPDSDVPNQSTTCTWTLSTANTILCVSGPIVFLSWMLTTHHLNCALHWQCIMFNAPVHVLASSSSSIIMFPVRWNRRCTAMYLFQPQSLLLLLSERRPIHSTLIITVNALRCHCRHTIISKSLQNISESFFNFGSGFDDTSNKTRWQSITQDALNEQSNHQHVNPSTEHLQSQLCLNLRHSYGWTSA